MALVNKFNVNREEVRLDADIIENMSANDVSYNSSLQYDENTVGNKLSELDQQMIYDVSAHNDEVTFASLSALLSSENLSTLIPVAVRCGGMCIRFVQSSDNKYVCFMLNAQDWTINTTYWEKINLEKEVEHLEQKINNKIGYSESQNLNDILRFLSIDITGYTGSDSLDGLKLTIYKNYYSSHFYGFQFHNGNNQRLYIEKYNYSPTTHIFSGVFAGVKVYIDVILEKMQDNSSITGTLNQSALYWDERLDTLAQIQTDVSSLNTDVSSLKSLKTDVSKLQVDIDGLFGTDAINQISGLSIGVPNQKFLQNTTASETQYGVLNEVDTISPFKDILGHSIELIPFGSGRNYLYNSSKINEYPSDMYFSYWVNGNEVTANNYFEIAWGFMDTDYQYPNIMTNLKSVVDYGIGYNIDTTQVKTNFTIAKNVKCVYSKYNWYQIIEHFAITWQESKKPWNFGLRLSLHTSALSFKIVNPQISYTELPIGVAVIEDVDNSVEPYPTSITELSEQIVKIQDKVDGLLTSMPNKLHLVLTEDTESYIVSPFNETYNIKLYFVLKRSVSTSHNQSFNFIRVNLVNKTTLAETTVHFCIDEICPSNFNGTYFGGNHANANIRKLTIPSHGLTYANIGDVWNYGDGGEATILSIKDTNNILVAGKNTEVYPKFFFPDIPTGTVLTKNGTTLPAVSDSTYEQWFSSTNHPSLDIFIDGKLVEKSGDYDFSELKICEHYDIMNTQSTIERLVTNKPSDGYDSNPNPASFTTADKVARHSIIYQFGSAKDWIIATTFTAYQDISLSRFGYTQQYALSGNVNLYIPKTLPIDDEAQTPVTLDFRTAPSYNSHTGILNITSDYWENPNLPPDRWMTYNDNIAIHSGFLYDFGIGGNNRKNSINNAFYLPSTNKIYINGIDSKLTVNAGDSYSGIVWRTYIDRSTIMSDGVISVNKVEYDDKLYLYADYNATGVYEFEIPDKFLGKPIDVFEKSSNVTLLTPISNRSILIKVESTSPMYGYLVAKIES